MVGRDAEVAAIEALLRAARQGRSATLVVSGEPGIGKTALLARARAAAGGAMVLETTGSEAETHLAFAGLADLLGPVLGHLDEIPAPQAAALRGALALGPPRPGDRFTAYAATLSLLAATAERGPLVCIVDDAQWLDAESFEAIQFSGRRLGAEGIALLLGVRDGGNPVTDGSGLPRLPLGRLDDTAAGRLLGEHSAVAPSAGVRRALIDGGAGNPLALIELATALDDSQLAGRSPLPDPLPVGRYLSRALLRPLDDLPAHTRRALLVASAGDGSAAYLGEALRADGRSFADLEPAERAGVIGVGPSRALFSHPLVRAAVYQAAPAPDRRSAHAAHAVAAERVSEAGALGRRAWHLALASAGPDERAAVELERAAQDAIGRNAHAAAMEALDAAARLSPDDVVRGGRMLAAAGSAIAGGSYGRAARLLDRAIGIGADSGQVVQAQIMRGYVEMFGGSARRAVAMLTSAADSLEERAPWRAASLLAQATAPAQLRGDGKTMRHLAARADRLTTGAPPEVRAIIETASASAETYGGRPFLPAEETYAQLASLAAGGDPMAHFWAVAVVQFRILAEQYATAREWLDGFVNDARASSMPSLLPFPLCMRADVLQRLGRLREARGDATEAAQVADETGQALMGSFAHGILARLDAIHGDADACRAHSRRSIADVAVNEAEILLSYADAALGLLALGEGRLTDALTRLSAVDHRIVHLGHPHPLIVPYAQDLVEVRIRLGETTAAVRRLDQLAAQSTATAWPLAAVARCRGLLASDDDFEAAFADALEMLDGHPTPFERARTALCLGERRRRARRPTAARAPLEEALSIFEALEATPWVAWTRRELRAAGGLAGSDHPGPLPTLTGQELRVALAVAAGATNREAAASLLISPKTVEYHLARVYTKMGLRSRSELAHRMARESADGAMGGGD